MSFRRYEPPFAWLIPSKLDDQCLSKTENSRKSWLERIAPTMPCQLVATGYELRSFGQIVAEGVERVRRVGILETMIQSQGRG